MHLNKNCTNFMLMIIVTYTGFLHKFYREYLFRVSPIFCIDIHININMAHDNIITCKNWFLTCDIILCANIPTSAVHISQAGSNYKLKLLYKISELSLYVLLLDTLLLKPSSYINLQLILWVDINYVIVISFCHV